MKIIITAQGPTLDSLVDPRFGRAKYLLLIDSNTGEYTTHDNTQNVNAMQGAGIQAGQNVAGLGADALLTGHLGPKAFSVLQAAGIKLYIGVSGTVQEALDAFRQGTYQAVERPDVQGHWV